MNDFGDVRVILLDDHGCLTHTGPGLAHRVGGFLGAAGVDVQPDALRRAVRAACDRHLEMPLGRITTVDAERDAWTALWTDVLAALEVPVDRHLVTRMHRACHYVGAKDAFPDTRAALAALGPRFRLCLATNALPMVRPALENLGLWAAFDRTFVSTLVGAEKPDRGFFQAVLAELELPPYEVMLVDDLPENVQGARDVGLRGVLIDRSAPAGRPTPGSVRSLTELVELVRSP